MAEGVTSKTFRDGAGASFYGEMFDRGDGVLIPRHVHTIFSTPADATFARPGNTTPYSIGDLIANSETAGSVTPLSFTGATLTGSGGKGRIARWIGQKSGTVAALIRYHFLKTAHAVTNGDNGALVFTSLDLDNYIGAFDVNFVGTYDGIGASGGLVAEGYPVGDRPLEYVLASGDTIYVFAQALVAFTPANAGTIGGRPVFERW